MDRRHVLAALAQSTPMNDVQLKASIIILYAAVNDVQRSNAEREIMDDSLDEAVRREETRLRLASQPGVSENLLESLEVARDQHLTTYMTMTANHLAAPPNPSRDVWTPALTLAWYMSVLMAREQIQAEVEGNPEGDPEGDQ